MAKQNLAQLLIEIEENCEMKTHAGVYIQLLEKCFKKRIFSRHRKNQKIDFVISSNSILWASLYENWKVWLLYISFLYISFFSLSILFFFLFPNWIIVFQFSPFSYFPIITFIIKVLLFPISQIELANCFFLDCRCWNFAKTQICCG